MEVSSIVAESKFSQSCLIFKNILDTGCSKIPYPSRCIRFSIFLKRSFVFLMHVNCMLTLGIFEVSLLTSDVLFHTTSESTFRGGGNHLLSKLFLFYWSWINQHNLMNQHDPGLRLSAPTTIYMLWNTTSSQYGVLFEHNLG